MSDYIKKMPLKFKEGAEYDFDTRKIKGEDASDYIKKMPLKFKEGAEYDFDTRKIKGNKAPGKGMKRGGTVRGDGIAKRGKTKGKMC